MIIRDEDDLRAYLRLLAASERTADKLHELGENIERAKDALSRFGIAAAKADMYEQEDWQALLDNEANWDLIFQEEEEQ